MNNNLEMKKIGQIAEVIAGQSPEGKYYNSDGKGLPFYQGKKEFGDKFLGSPTTWTTEITKVAEAGDILMSVRAPVGPINFATDRICIGRGLAAIRANKNLDKDFLFYGLLSKQDEICGRDGAVFASINKNEIADIHIPCPPLLKQQRIVAVLDEAFAGIATATENAEKNLRNARELYENTKTSIFYEIKQKETTVLIEYVCDEIFAGGDAPKDNFSLEKTEKYNTPIIANAVKDNGLYGYTDFARVIKPSVTVAARGSGTGHTEVRYEPFYPIVRLIVLTPDTAKIHIDFFKYAVQDLEILRSGSAIPQLTVPMIKGYSVPLPPLKTQQHIVAKLDTLSAQTQRLESTYQQKLAYLDELKKSILQKAFAGELHTTDRLAA